MKFRIKDVRFYMLDCRTRIPFQFGIANMTWAPMLVARVTIEVGGQSTSTGASADLLVPKWFDKTPELSFRQNIEDLVASARNAAAAIMADQGTNADAFEHWHRLYRTRYAGLAADANTGLVAGFGVALIERAVIDAVCRAGGLSFHEAMRGGALGLDAGRIHAELEDWDVRGTLADKPASVIRARHTVGLADPLRTAHIGAEDRLRDGLPQSLEENIETYGLECFKIKVAGDLEADLSRLTEISGIIGARAPHALITIDGNEQFADPDDLVLLLERLESSEEGRFLLANLHLIEQPLPRSITFDTAATAAIGQMNARAPVIIDESDSGIESFHLAVERGYRGVSVKNCKGVFRSFLKLGLCERLARESGERFVLSAEDLTNLAILPLQQDLCSVASLGISHVERNGHHYFPGLEHLPGRDADQALRDHPSLYRRYGDDGVALAIRGGNIRLDSLDVPGFGDRGTPTFDEYVPLEDWRYEAQR